MKEQNKEDPRKWAIVIVIIIVLFLFLPKLFEYFQKSRKTRLEEEIEQLETEIRVLQSLKKGEQKKIEWLEFLNKYVPYVIRVSFVLLLLIYDYLMLLVFSQKSSKFIIILKDVAVYNASLLSIILCIAFIFNGKMWKIEEIVTYINQSINNSVFNYYFPKADNRYNSKSWYKEDIEKRELQIAELKVELIENGATSYSK